MTPAIRPISKFWAALAAVFLIALLGACAAGPARGETAARFRSNGDVIAGWSWLRDAGLSDYAEYTFPNPPEQGDILLDITALATDGVNGGPRVNAWFDLLVGNPGSGNMGGVFHRIGLTLQNIYPKENPPGYTNHGMLTLSRATLEKVMPADGTLFIRIVRASARGPHVAFRPDSIQIVRGGSGELLQDLLDGLAGGGHLGGGTLGGGDIVIDHGGTGTGGGTIVIERGGGTVTPPDGIVTDLRPELGDWGDEGWCVLERPCLGAAADGFRSSGFPGQEGWFWLRAPTVGQSAEYLFEHPPLTGDLVLDIAVLAQNQVAMTPKDTVHVGLTLGYPGSGSLGGQIGPVTVEIPKLWSGPDDDIWRGRALLVVPRHLAEAAIPAVGGLFLSFDRIDAFEPDLAFSAGSVLLIPAQDIGR